MTTKAPGRLSLTEYAAKKKSRTNGRSWMETNLPPEVLEECKAGWAAGLRATTILEWLKSLGYEEATSGRVGWLEKHADE